MQKSRKNKIFSKISNRLQSCDNNKIICITGPYGAGKTTFAKNLSKFLEKEGRNVVCMSTDMYFSHSRKKRHDIHSGKGDYHERMNKAYKVNLGLIKKHLKMIKNGENIPESGLYQRSTGNKDLVINIRFDKPTIVLFEGIHSIHASLRKYYEFRIYLDLNYEERKKRVASRETDAKKREIIIRKFKEVERHYNELLSKNRKDDDIIINN